MVKIKKLETLKEPKIREILAFAPELKSLTKEIFPEVQALLASGKYKILKDISTKEEYEENFELILSFLQKVGILGKEFEEREFDHENYKIGPEGLAIVNAFYRDKEKYKGLPTTVQVVSDRFDRKQIFIPRYGSYYKDFIHSRFLEQLLKDLPHSQENQEFDRVYIVLEGEVGSNHAFCVAVRKGVDGEPFVELFDSSPGLTRSGIKELESKGIVPKTSPSLVTIATVAAAFKEKGYELKKDNFFQNSEPFQRSGLSYCGTFATERAYEIASMPRDFHEKELRRIYKYDSIVGGKTEIDLTLEEVITHERAKRDGKAIAKLGADKEKVIESQLVPMTHFGSHYTDSRGKSGNKMHLIKKGLLEALDERRKRYLEKIEGGKGFFSEIVHQKSMRHRIHLFEILKSDAFRDFYQESLKDMNLQKVGMEEYIDKRKVAVAGGDVEKSVQRENFEEKYGLCKNFDYDEASDSVKILIRCGGFIKGEIERDFAARPRKDISVKIEDSEPESQASVFEKMGIVKGFTKRYFVDIEIQNAKSFFAELAEEKAVREGGGKKVAASDISVQGVSQLSQVGKIAAANDLSQS